MISTRSTYIAPREKRWQKKRGVLRGLYVSTFYFKILKKDVHSYQNNHSNRTHSTLITEIYIMYQTSRLILRRFQDHDFPQFYTFMRDPRVGQWLDKPNGLTQEQAQAMMKRLQDTWHIHNYGPFAVIEKSSNQLIGYCGIKHVDRFQLPEVLYGLHPDYWGKGLITEAGKKVLEIAEKEWGIKKVIAYTLPTNLASQGVMKNLGLRYTKNIIHADLDHVFFERDLMLLSE